jgi:hypothetical protein
MIRIPRLLARLALFVLIGPLGAGIAHASRLPDWASAIAAGAPELPAGVPPSDTRMILSEVRYSVQPDGSYRIRRRLALQAMTVNTEDVGPFWYPFEETVKVTATRAWHVAPGNSAKKSHETPVDVSVGDSFLSGAKARVIPVQGIKKGSLVFIEVEATEKPYFLNFLQLFYEGIPVMSARLEIETPPGWSERWVWLRGGGPEPVTSGLIRSWELKDLPAPAREEMAPLPVEQAPLLGINLQPPAGATVTAPVFSDWRSVGEWYEKLAKERGQVTPAIESAAKQVSSGSAPAEAIVSSSTWVRDRVRYVAVELGIGGFQPRAASETLANLYGDCKDKATLLQAFLGAQSIRSYPVLVNAGGHEALSEQVPVWQFNHMVLAAAIPADSPLAARFAAARVDDPELGPLAIIDSTDEMISVGSLSAGLAGQKALLVAGPRTRLITLPAARPSSHVLERRWSMKVSPSGSLEVSEVSRFVGQPAGEARAGWRTDSQDRRRGVEARWTRLWSDATPSGYKVDPESADGAFVERLEVSRPARTDTSHFSGLELFPTASFDIPRVPLGKRKSLVDYVFPRTLRYEASIEGLPAETRLPDPQAAQGAGWEGKTSFKREGERIIASCEIFLTATSFPPESFAELRKFWNTASTLESGSIALHP